MRITLARRQGIEP